MPAIPLNSIRKTLLLISILAAPILSGCSEESLTSATATPENVLFFDSFSPGSSANWHTEADEAGRTAIENGKMTVAVNTENTLQYTTLRNETFDDFILEVEVSAIEGAAENSYGILFRMQNASEFYRFDITGDGKFMVERSDVGETWTRYLDDWTFSEAINQGKSSFNKLRIKALGPNLTFYINDIEVHQVQDSQYLSGSIALDAGTFGESSVTATFDNILIFPP
jgi:hypothetical protein